MIDITSKHLSEQFPVYTKAGKVWKNRINWDEALKPGAVISTHFGIFTFVDSYKEGKDWYIKLLDGNKYYIMKRNQARKNKKLPKTSIIQQVIYLSKIKLVDSLLEQAISYIKTYNEEHIVKYGTRGKIGVPKEYLLKRFSVKISTILSVGFINESLYNKFRRQLINYYHPDNGNVQDSRALTIISDYVDVIKRTKGIL